MNAARRAARAGRNLLIALLAGAVILIVIVVAYMLGKNGSTPTSAPSSRPNSATTSVADGSGADAAPTGCLGGPDIGDASLLSAQHAAAHSTLGAVEVAASFLRWGYRYPTPTASEVAGVSSLFPQSSRSSSIQALVASYQRNPNPAHGVLADGTAFELSTSSGSWVAQPGADGAEVKVSVIANMVIDGAVSPTKTSAEAFDMTWDRGSWRIMRFAAAQTDELSSGGTGFTAGC